MEAEHWIAISGILISAVIAYFTAKITLSVEKDKGKLILIELIKQYLINFNSSFDLVTKKPKTDNLTKEQFLRVLEFIEAEFKDLINNPYYLELTNRYTRLSMLQVSITREIARLKSSKEFGLSNESIQLSFDLFDVLKKDIKKKYFKKGERFFELNNLIDEWKVILKTNTKA